MRGSSFSAACPIPSSLKPGVSINLARWRDRGAQSGGAASRGPGCKATPEAARKAIRSAPVADLKPSLHLAPAAHRTRALSSALKKAFGVGVYAEPVASRAKEIIYRSEKVGA